MNFRNIAIIAHVDHGKTTLVDAMLRQSGIFRANEDVAERVMDSNDLERERGITILAKNTGVRYHDVKINIVDTPGHSDFGGEVERALKMVDGVMLLVDASEGPLPQTRYVLSKALEAGCRRSWSSTRSTAPDARTQEVLNEVYDLFIDLDATEDQLEFPVIYTNAKAGIARPQPDGPDQDLRPLFDAILEHIPAPPGDPDGRAAAAGRQPRLQRLPGPAGHRPRLLGHARAWATTVGVRQARRHAADDASHQALLLRGPEARRRRRTAGCGEILAIAGVEGITIGETVTSAETPAPLPQLHIDEPTIVMTFTINTSPFAGREGTWVTSRNLATGWTRSCSPTSPSASSRPTGRRLQGDGPRRAAARHPDRDDAARRLRADGRQPRDPHPRRGRRAQGAARSCCVIDCPRPSSAWSSRRWACARAR